MKYGSIWHLEFNKNGAFGGGSAVIKRKKRRKHNRKKSGKRAPCTEQFLARTRAYARGFFAAARIAPKRLRRIFFTARTAQKPPQKIKRLFAILDSRSLGNHLRWVAKSTHRRGDHQSPVFPPNVALSPFCVLIFAQVAIYKLYYQFVIIAGILMKN